MSEAIRRPFGSTCLRRTRWFMGAGVGASIIAASGASAAATWTNARTTPPLSEIVALDATGESGWPYGQEDVAGDGLATFAQPEQMVDIRTAYAATDMSRFWARVYFSDPNGVGAGLTAYIFIDADRNVATGGRAIGAEIDPAFTTDPSPGGYDFVLAVGSNGAVAGLWEYQVMQGMYVTLNPNPANSSGETGADADPILINGSQHGYVQGNVDLNIVRLTSTCDANLFVRSVNAGAGDLDVGQVGRCVPADGNQDGVPDIVTPPGGCSSDAQCPGGGRCNNGVCTVPPTCTMDGGCEGNVVLAPGEKVEGGALHCSVSPWNGARPPLNRGDVPLAAAAVAATLALGARRRRMWCS